MIALRKMYKADCKPAMLYTLMRQLLFCLNPEAAHDVTFNLLQRLGRGPLDRLFASRVPASPRTVMGLRFPNPVGLAAGLDKNGDYLDVLGALGFGFIELGTVTPHPQPGNPRPRLFRLVKARALINRLGFNNQGVDYLIEQIRGTQYPGVIGINIGKNAVTPLAHAIDDYRIGLQKVYPYAHYVAVNISSPNTPGLRNLQQGEALIQLLTVLKDEQTRLTKKHGRYVPLAVKIAPDLDDEAIDWIAKTLMDHQVDGVIATNTTCLRPGVAELPYAQETGGLSGKPLAERSTQVIAQLQQSLQGNLPIIAVGGILCGADAEAKLAAGASLVQLYTGLIYRGPRLVREVAVTLSSKLSQSDNNVRG
jgi:dihydroorotate dehydrogenase